MEYRIKSRLWIEANGEILLGEGRVRLLKAIDQTGSLSKAARSIGMSYKKAWSLVDKVNSRAEKPVISTSVGGTKGGGTALTDYGRELVTTFEQINRKCWGYLDEQLENSKL